MTKEEFLKKVEEWEKNETLEGRYPSPYTNEKSILVCGCCNNALGFDFNAYYSACNSCAFLIEKYYG